MSYLDLDGIQIPADNADATAAWGQQVESNSGALWAMLAQGWQAWINGTPSSLTTVGNAEREGYYHHIGYTVTGMFTMKVGSTSSFTAGNTTINLPQAYADTGCLKVVGSFVWLDASTGKYWGGIVVTNNTGSASTAALWYGGGTSLSATSPFEWATGDTLMVNVFYETGAAGIIVDESGNVLVDESANQIEE